MAIFYHITKDLHHDGLFTPRIPGVRYQDEDEKMGRISVSNSIEGCLTAIPEGGSDLEEFNLKNNGYYKVFKIDTNKLNIKKEDILDSEYLYQNDLVGDADITKEVWILKPFQIEMQDTFLIQLQYWIEVEELVVPFSIFELANKFYSGDFELAYRKIYKKKIPWTISIEKIEFISNEKEAMDPITIFCKKEKMEKLNQYIIENKIDILTKQKDYFILNPISLKKLTELFIYHSQL